MCVCPPVGLPCSAEPSTAQNLLKKLSKGISQWCCEMKRQMNVSFSPFHNGKEERREFAPNDCELSPRGTKAAQNTFCRRVNVMGQFVTLAAASEGLP